jgi:hypothetical protein
MLKADPAGINEEAADNVPTASIGLAEANAELPEDP